MWINVIGSVGCSLSSIFANSPGFPMNSNRKSQRMKEREEREKLVAEEKERRALEEEKARILEFVMIRQAEGVKVEVEEEVDQLFDLKKSEELRFAEAQRDGAVAEFEIHADVEGLLPEVAEQIAKAIEQLENDIPSSSTAPPVRRGSTRGRRGSGRGGGRGGRQGGAVETKKKPGRKNAKTTKESSEVPAPSSAGAPDSAPLVPDAPSYTIPNFLIQMGKLIKDSEWMDSDGIPDIVKKFFEEVSQMGPVDDTFPVESIAAITGLTRKSPPNQDVPTGGLNAVLGKYDAKVATALEATEKPPNILITEAKGQLQEPVQNVTAQKRQRPTDDGPAAKLSKTFERSDQTEVNIFSIMNISLASPKHPQPSDFIRCLNRLGIHAKADDLRVRHTYEYSLKDQPKKYIGHISVSKFSPLKGILTSLLQGDQESVQSALNAVKIGNPSEHTWIGPLISRKDVSVYCLYMAVSEELKGSSTNAFATPRALIVEDRNGNKKTVHFEELFSGDWKDVVTRSLQRVRSDDRVRLKFLTRNVPNIAEFWKGTECAGRYQQGSDRLKMGVSLDPSTCVIGTIGGTSKHKMINHTDRLMAFVVKSLNNSSYIVDMSCGILKGGEEKEMVITRKPGELRDDKLTIQYCQVDNENVDPMPLFIDGLPLGEMSGETSIKLSAAE